MSDDDKRLAGAACAGAAGALVLAMFAPAAVLLGTGLLAAGGVALYKRHSRSANGANDAGGADGADHAGGTHGTHETHRTHEAANPAADGR